MKCVQSSVGLALRKSFELWFYMDRFPLLSFPSANYLSVMSILLIYPLHAVLILIVQGEFYLPNFETLDGASLLFTL